MAANAATRVSNQGLELGSQAVSVMSHLDLDNHVEEVGGTLAGGVAAAGAATGVASDAAGDIELFVAAEPEATDGIAAAACCCLSACMLADARRRGAGVEEQPEWLRDDAAHDEFERICRLFDLIDADANGLVTLHEVARAGSGMTGRNAHHVE